MTHKNSGSGPAHESRPTIQTHGFAFVLVRVSDETDLDETMVDWAPGTSAGAGSRVTAERPGWRIVDREPMTYEEWLVIEHGEVPKHVRRALEVFDRLTAVAADR